MTNCDGTDCEKALENLYLFIDHEIDTASSSEIQSHIDECSECLNVYDLERLVKALVSRSCTEVAPEVLRQKVLVSIRTVQVCITETKATGAPANQEFPVRWTGNSERSRRNP